MERLIENRRSFLKHASIAAAFPLIFSCKGDTAAQLADKGALGAIRKNAIDDSACNWCGARDVPANNSWRTILAGPADKGERMQISGTVYQADGKAPAADTLIYLYHTDVQGVYGRTGEHRHGRYRGWMLTDEKGRYEFETIMPASYPNSTIAAHIHMTLTTSSMKEDWIDSIIFEGDRFITAAERTPRKGGFDPVLKMVKGSDNIMRGTRNIKLMA